MIPKGTTPRLSGLSRAMKMLVTVIGGRLETNRGTEGVGTVIETDWFVVIRKSQY